MPYGARERKETLVISRKAWQGAAARANVPCHALLGEGGGQLGRRRARGLLNPCARESKARTRRFQREKVISDHDLFSSYESQQGAANGQDFWGVFQGCAGLRTAACWLVCRLHQLKASTAMHPGISNFLAYFCMTCGLEKLGLAAENAGRGYHRRQPSESIEVGFDMKYGGLIKRCLG